MLLKGKNAVISGAASARGIGRATAKLFAEHGARVAVLDLDAEGAKNAASELGNGHIGLGCDVADLESCEKRGRCRRSRPSVRSISSSTMPVSPSLLKLMEIAPERLAARRRREHDGRTLPEPGLRPAHALAEAGLDRVHVVGVGAARRRHLRRAALLGRQGRCSRPRQGDGARTWAGRHPGQQRHTRPDPDRHYWRQAHAGDADRHRQGHPARTARATPRTWPGSTFSSPPTSRPTSRAR